MKKRKKLIIIIIIIVFILGLICLFLNSNSYKKLQDDLLFIRFLKNDSKLNIDNRVNNDNENNLILEFDNNSINSKANMQYIFNIEYKNTKFQDVNLINTIDSKTLVNEKIAPGAKGFFDIIIYSNHNSRYNVYFESLNEKPSNLKFFIVGTKIYKEKLEELSSDLSGVIKKGEKKIITIGWEWTYENGVNGNKQDTDDAKLMNKYMFNILAVGEEII